jgi:hypothetical protein
VQGARRRVAAIGDAGVDDVGEDAGGVGGKEEARL